MNPKDIENLKKYVMDQITGVEVNDSILTMLHASEPVEMVVYRGHTRTPVINKGLFYSSTLYERIAREEFAGGECCVFKIHLINVPVINVNKFLKEQIKDYEEEQEYIFLGGGTFFQNREMTIEGFKDNGDGNYECWYTMENKIDESKSVDESKQDMDIERILGIIDEEEYVLIESVEDVKETLQSSGITVSNEDAKKVFEHIQKLQDGGKKKKNKTRKQKKSKRQRKNKKKSKKHRK